MAISAKEPKPRAKRIPKAKPPADATTNPNEKTTSTSGKPEDKVASSNPDTTPIVDQKTKTKKPISARSTKATPKSLIKSQVIEVDPDESDQDRMDISDSNSKKDFKAKDLTDPSDEEVDESDEIPDSDGSEDTDLSGFIARSDVVEEEDGDDYDDEEEEDGSDDESVDESNERSESSLFQEKKSHPNIPFKALKPSKPSNRSHSRNVGKYGSDDEYEFN
jgi:hypothetical protein